jgi:RNA recognition motif-containing protein
LLAIKFRYDTGGNPLGTVCKFKLMTNNDTDLSRGFAFVEMVEVEAARAIAALGGRIVDGQAIAVREGRAKLRRSASLQRRVPRP